MSQATFYKDLCHALKRCRYDKCAPIFVYFSKFYIIYINVTFKKSYGSESVAM